MATSKTGTLRDKQDKSYVESPSRGSTSSAQEVFIGNQSSDSLPVDVISQPDNIIASSSSVVFSDVQATLADESEIDTGFIDFNGADKIQFTVRADAVGLSFVTESRANDTQDAFSTSSTINTTFFLANTTIRQRFLRVRIQNNTGEEVSNVSLEIKVSYGSSDKLSVFPVSTQPNDFSQAGLVQAILRGRSQDGNFTNVGTNDVGALNISNFLIDVAREKYDAYRIETKSGRNSDIDTGSDPEDIWNGGGDYTGFNAVENQNLQTFSSSTQDSGSLVTNGICTSFGNNTMSDSGATFITDGVDVGDLLINDTQGFHGVIREVTNETLLKVHLFTDGVIEDNEFEVGDGYRVATTNGTGAAVVKWQKILNSDYERQLDKYVILNGTTAVTTTSNAFRCSRGKVILAGSSGFNEGELTLRQQDTTANIFAVMPANSGQTAICCDTVEKDKTRIITNLYAILARANGAAGSARMQFQVRSVGEAWQTKRFPTITNSSSYSPIINADIIIKEKSDIRWRAQSVSDNNAQISAEFEYLEISDDVAVSSSQEPQVALETEFNGTDEFINFGSNLRFQPNDPFTISFWITPDSVSGRQGIISNFLPTSPFSGYLVSLSNDAINVGFYNDFGAGNYIDLSTATGVISSGIKQHITLQYDGSLDESGIDIRVDGVGFSEFPTQNNLSGSITYTTQDFIIGQQIDTNDYFDGKIDELLIYNRRLTDSECNELYNGGTVPSSETLSSYSDALAHFKMGEGSTAPNLKEEISGASATMVNMDDTNFVEL